MIDDSHPEERVFMNIAPPEIIEAVDFYYNLAEFATLNFADHPGLDASTPKRGVAHFVGMTMLDWIDRDIWLALYNEPNMSIVMWRNAQLRHSALFMKGPARQVDCFNEENSRYYWRLWYPDMTHRGMRIEARDIIRASRPRGE